MRGHWLRGQLMVEITYAKLINLYWYEISSVKLFNKPQMFQNKSLLKCVIFICEFQEGGGGWFHWSFPTSQKVGGIYPPTSPPVSTPLVADNTALQICMIYSVQNFCEVYKKLYNCCFFQNRQFSQTVNCHRFDRFFFPPLDHIKHKTK